MSFLITNKWWILLFFEWFAWGATFYMFFARYWINSHTQFIFSAILAGVTGYVPHIVLAILEFIRTGKISVFIMFIVILFLFGLTLGKNYIKKMDSLISTWAHKKKGNRCE